jgi:signal transduction histidine kinase
VRRAPVRIRTFILATVLALVLLPVLAGVAAFQIERDHQRADIRQRLDTAFGYLSAHRMEMRKPGNVQAFAGLLDRLGLFAQVSLIMKVPPGKTLIYTSPALTPTVTSNQVTTGTAKARGSRATLPTAGTKSPANGDATAERVIPVITRNSAGALTAELYVSPASRSAQALAALVAGLAVLLAGLAVALWLAGRWMVTPLRRLSSQVDKVAGGDLEIAVPGSRIGEIANIAQAVEGMTVALGESAQRRAEADEARRFLVTSIAHDLRTPLFALRGHLQAVRSGLGDPAVHLGRAEARADALERLVGNLFAFTRDDYARPTLQLEAVPVVELLEDAAAGLEHAGRLGGHTFVLDGDPTIAVAVDRDRVKRALTNILDNALRHSPAGAPIELTWIAPDASTVEITVRDRGAGIDAELLPHIFEPGVRGAPSAGDYENGSGLGLTISKRLLEQQRATVTARNQPAGGAVLSISLERAASTHEPGLNASRRRAALHGPEGVGR